MTELARLFTRLKTGSVEAVLYPCRQRILLSDREPLIFKAARWLITLSMQRPLDLSRCAVLVPTSGSGRRLRSELVRLAAERGKGLLSPVVLTPMGFLARAAGEKIAGRIDTLLAWTQVISEVAP